jgi:hypothetical protein
MKKLTSLHDSVKQSIPMFFVRDVRATIRWYESIGFTTEDKYQEDDELLYARLSFGSGRLALSAGGTAGPTDVRLWFFTNRVEDLYTVLKGQQQGDDAAAGALTDQPPLSFDEELYEPFYGGRQFSIRDNNGLALVFWQPVWLTSSTSEDDPAAETSDL